jgi:hypothetical protein
MARTTLNRTAEELKRYQPLKAIRQHRAATEVEAVRAGLLQYHQQGDSSFLSQMMQARLNERDSLTCPHCGAPL